MFQLIESTPDAQVCDEASRVQSGLTSIQDCGKSSESQTLPIGGEESSTPAVESTWVTCSASDLLHETLAEKVADAWDNRLGCAVWLIHRNGSGKIVETVLSRTAKELMLSSESIATIASDASQNNCPIVTNCHPKLPATPSAILDRLALTHAGYGAISSHLPMTSVDGGWIVILAWRHSADYSESLSIAASLDLHGPSLGQTLEAYTIAKSGRKLLSVVDTFNRWKSIKMRWIVTGLTALGLFLAVPVPYRPLRDCILEPTSRKFVSSPIEGRLTAISVRPGEVVSEGQLLASIDEQPIRRELLIAEADLQSANKRRDVALATRASGDLRLAQLECQQIQLKIESMQEQLSRLEIHSPASGVIVQGDWFGNEGMPVTLGQSLFEIAPLDRMTAEIQLTAEDLPWVHVGSQAVLRTDATGTKSWPSVLRRIEPRAEVIDDKAVYIAEMEIENSSKLFRPGMKGQTVVDTGRHSIGWLLLGKPYRWFVNLWVW